MASNWQETYEQLKKKKKELDTGTNTSDSNTALRDNLIQLPKTDVPLDLLRPTIGQSDDPTMVSTFNTKIDDKKWYQKFFKGSEAFDDGYDIGDISKTILGTASDLGNNMAKGVASLVEAPIDILSYGTYAGLDLVGAKNASKEVKKFADRNLSQEVADKYTKDVSISAKAYNMVSNVQDEYKKARKKLEAGDTSGAKDTINNMLKTSGKGFVDLLVSPQITEALGFNKKDKEKIVEEIKNNSVSGDTTDKVAELIGYTLSLGGATSLLAKTGTKTLGSVTTNAAGTTIGSGVTANAGNIGLTVAGKTLNLPTLAIAGGMSSGLNEAYQKEGVTHAQAWTKGLTSGVIEGVTEGMFGLMDVGGNELTDQMASKLASQFSSSFGKQAANIVAKGGGESFEELASYTLNWLTDNNVIDKMKGADFKSEWDWHDVSEQMALAFISAGVTQGSATALQVNTQVNEIINEKEEELGRSLTSEEKSAIRSEAAQKIIDAENGQTQEVTPVRQETNVLENQIDTNTPNIAPIQENTIEQRLDAEKRINQLEEIKKQATTEQQFNDIQNEINELSKQVQQENKTNVKEMVTNEDYTPVKEVETTQDISPVQETQQEVAPVKELKTNAKQKQLDVINKTNKMTDDYHTGIRSIEDIKSANEVFTKENFEEASNPDFTYNQSQEALKNGKVTVYSSNPIENGSFISTSKMMAQDYAGNNKVYSQEVNLDDVAWIDNLEGQYAKTSINEVQNTTPTQQELDNLADVKANKSGSEYNVEFGKLEKKYGQVNLYKGLNNYYSTGKAIEDIAPIKAEISDLTSELKNTIKDTKKELKALTKEIKGVKQDVSNVVDDMKAITEQDLPIFEQQNREAFQNITDNDIAPIQSNVVPEIEENTSEVQSPLENRDFDEVGKRSVNAYQYDNPEVRPYFQQAANYMLNDLYGTTKGERVYNDKLYYETNGEDGWYGTTRQTTDDIKELLDGSYHYSYADIEKGLKAIIEDHGAENIAVAKRLEFILDNRLRNGYKDVDGYDIPADQDYINLLREKEFSDYYSSIPMAEPTELETQQEDIAPIQFTEEEILERNKKLQESSILNATENHPPLSDEFINELNKQSIEWARESGKLKEVTPVREQYEAITPKENNGGKMIRISPENRAEFENKVAESNKEIKNELGYVPKDPTRASTYLEDTSKETTTNQEIAKILDSEPKTENQRNKRKAAIIAANVLDKGLVFENVALKNKNRNLMGKWDYTLTSEARGQNAIGQGHYEYNPISKTSKQVSKSLNDIRAEVDNTGLTNEFTNYIYHKHNIDRMNLEGRYEDTLNKPVFGDSVTSEVSQQVVDQYENEHPEFMDYAQDVYDYVNADRQELVKNGVISQETADLWSEMYPHYVPIRRVDNTGQAINVPLDTGRTGVNAPIKKATGGSSDILPLFDTIAQRTLQTYRATAKNSFGVELKNTLGTTVDNQQANIDEVINDIDQQDGLLQENNGKPTFTVFENGEKVTFSITQDMYDALKPLSDSSILSKTIKPLNVASSIHRGVLTQYNPLFALTNGIKDAQDVLFNSQHTAKTYSKIPEAWGQYLKKGYWYQEYVANGGEQNSYFDSQEMNFDTEKKGISKITETFPLKQVAQLNDFIEIGPRLAEYIASRESGRSIETSMLDAARVTTNFKAGGNLTKFLNRNGATFLNASVQGAMQQVRNIREANMNGLKGWVNLATKFAIAGLPAIVLNGLVWKDDEDYEEESDYVKQNYYLVAKYGDGNFVRIPKGRTVAVIQNAIEQVGKAASGNDEADLKEFLNLVVSNLAPNNPIENNILSPILQVANNKTWYGEDLVPSRLKNLPAKEQFDEGTDSFSKWLGDKLNISPMKINYVLDQYSGGVGDTILPMMTPEAKSGDDGLLGNLIAPFKSKFTTNATMNNQNTADFYDTSDKLETEAKKKNATDEDKIKYKYLNSVQSEMNDLYEEKREVQNSNLSKSEKYEQVKSIQEKINELSKNAMEQYKNGSYKSNYASIGGQDFYKHKNSDGEEEWTKVRDEESEDLNKLNLSNNEKNKYFITKYDISDITEAYKDDKEELTGDEESKVYKNAVSELSSKKKKSIIDEILDSDLSNKGKEYLYSKYYTGEKTLGKITSTGTSMNTYLNFVKDTMDYEADLDDDGKKISGSLNNKYEKYLLESNLSDNDKTTLYEYGVLSSIDDEDKNKDYKTMKSAGVDINSWLDFDSQVFESDYNNKGKAITNSKKNKVISYVNSLDLSIPQKAMMIRSKYSSFREYNNDIVNYVVDLDLDYEDKVFMLETLNMEVSDDGTVSWK